MTTTKRDERSGRQVTGRTVLLAMIGFFGVIAAVNAVMIWLATSSHTGIVVDSAWRSSGNWQQEIEAARAQEALGWTVEIDIARNGDGADVTARVADANGAPVDGIDLSVRLLSPTGPAGDRIVTLRAQDNGRFAGSLDTLGSGRWDVLVDAETVRGRVFRSQSTMVVR